MKAIVMDMFCPRCSHEWKEPLIYFVSRIQQETKIFIDNCPESERDAVIKAFDIAGEKSPLKITIEKTLETYKKNGVMRVFCRNCQLETTLEQAIKTGCLKEFGYEI